MTKKKEERERRSVKKPAGPQGDNRTAPTKGDDVSHISLTRPSGKMKRGEEEEPPRQ